MTARLPAASEGVLSAAVPRPAPNSVPACVSGSAIDHPVWRLKGLADALARAARERADGRVTCVARDGRETSWTFRGLHDDACRAAAMLHARGIAPGSRVVLRLGDPGAFVLALWACFAGGLVAIPTHAYADLPSAGMDVQALVASLRALDPAALIVPAAERERATQLNNAHGWAHLAVLTDDDLRAAAPATVPPGPPADADRVAVIFPTSGSTGVPKPVMQTERALLAMSAGSAQMNAFDRSDIFLNWMPMEHVGAVVFLGVLPVCALADQVHVDHRLWHDRMPDWLDGLTRFRASVGWVPDHVLHVVAKALEQPGAHRWDLSALRFLVDAGESISPAFVHRFAERLRPYGLQEGAIRPAFGMSETCSGISWASGFHTVEGRYVDLGAPIPGAQLRIVDARGQVLPEGRIGHLQVRGPTVTQGYFGAARDEKFLADGWFDSGDAGFIQEGRLYLTDREGDGLDLQGVALHSHELETAIESLPGVLGGHAAVFTATPGDTLVLAAVFCVDPAHPAPAAVRAAAEAVLREHAPGLRLMVQTLAPQELPRTSIGKIQRKTLRRRLEKAAGGPAQTRTK